MNELRVLEDSQISVRSNEDGGVTVRGYASVFNQKSRLITENGRVFYEIIKDGAFDDALMRSDLNVVANLYHDNKLMLARSKSGTLTLGVDGYGLYYEFVAPNTTLGKDTVELLMRGDLRESSFKYNVKDKDVSWSRGADGVYIREVIRVNSIMDVAIVTNGAFGNTDVGVVRGIDIESVESEIENAEVVRGELMNYFSNLKQNFYGECQKIDI